MHLPTNPNKTSATKEMYECLLSGAEIKQVLNDEYKLLTCHVCSENFLNLEELQEHFLYCITVTCERCQLSFANSEEMNLHQKQCKIYHCNMCPKRFISAPTLETHQLTKHSTYDCEFCEIKFSNDLQREIHKGEMHHFVCEWCKKSFDSSLQAVSHRLSSNVPGDKLLCSFCYGSYQYIPKMKNDDGGGGHISQSVEHSEDYILPDMSTPHRVHKNRTVRIERSYPCTSCDSVSFHSELELNNHVKEYHMNPFLDNPSKARFTALHKYGKQVDILFDTKTLASDFENQSNYTCVLCNKVYKTFSMYCKHVYHFHKLNLLLGSSKKYHCHECSIDKDNLRELNNHLYARHENTMPCEHCTQAFSSRKDLKLHVVQHHPNEPAFRCITCPHKFYTQADLKKHCSWHWFQELTECPTCGKKFKGKKKLKEHMKCHISDSVEDTGLSCLQCGKTFNSKSGLRGHMRNVHSNLRKETVLCGECGMLVKSMRFKRHYDRVHGIGRAFACELCPRSFFCKELLRQHSDTHIEGRPHECNSCPAAFKQLRNLRMHIRNYHSVPTNHCKVCNMKFETVEECINHREQVHKKSKKLSKADSGEGYQCPHCPKEVKTIRALASHMRMMHEEQMDIQCSQCDQKFAFVKQLQNHMSVHSGPKPDLSCNVCGKMFTTLGSLNSHIKWVHIGERNFQCTYCPSKFKRKDAQIVHERTHTDERPYTCSVCNRKFRQRTDCKRHEAKHNLPGFKYNRSHRVRAKDHLQGRPDGEVVIEEVVEGVEEEHMDTSDALMLLEVPTQEDHQAAAFLSYIVQN